MSSPGKSSKPGKAASSTTKAPKKSLHRYKPISSGLTFCSVSNVASVLAIVLIGLVLNGQIPIPGWESGASTSSSADFGGLSEEEYNKWMDYVAPKYPFITGEAKRIEWDPEREFANEIAAIEEPVILTNTAATKWKAMTAWNPSYLASRMPELKRVQTHKNRTFVYFHAERPLSELPGINDNYKSTTYSRVNMSSVDFFLKLLRPPPYEDFYYYTDNVDTLGLAAADLHPVEPLMVKTKDFNADDAYKYRWTNVWIGPSGVTTHLHYDVYHNFYAQIHGWKRFILFPPENFNYLYLYPFLHPGGQSSQVNLDDINLEKFPDFKHARAIEAVLGPGDVLYLPPLWFHEVIALDLSMSVSVWTHPKETKAMWDLPNHPLPIPRSWPEEKRSLAIRLYLEMLLEDVLGVGSSKKFLARLFEQRYSKIALDVSSMMPTDLSFCKEGLEYDEDFEEEFSELAEDTIEEVVKLFRVLKKSSAVEIWLGNYVEQVALIAGGDAAHVGPFIRDLIEC